MRSKLIKIVTLFFFYLLCTCFHHVGHELHTSSFAGTQQLPSNPFSHIINRECRKHLRKQNVVPLGRDDPQQMLKFETCSFIRTENHEMAAQCVMWSCLCCTLQAKFWIYKNVFYGSLCTNSYSLFTVQLASTWENRLSLSWKLKKVWWLFSTLTQSSHNFQMKRKYFFMHS